MINVDEQALSQYQMTKFNKAQEINAYYDRKLFKHCEHLVDKHRISFIINNLLSRSYMDSKIKINYSTDDLPDGNTKPHEKVRYYDDFTSIKISLSLYKNFSINDDQIYKTIRE